MKTILPMLSLASLLSIGSAAAQAPQPTPPAVTFEDGFCLGWNTAVRMEQIRFGSWSRQILAGRPAPDTTGISAVVEGAGRYVTLRELASKLKLDDGREIDCTPKAEPK